MQKLLLLLLGISLTLCGAGFLYGSDNLALGAPGQAETIIDRDGYALGYSPEHRQAVWVIYKLTAGEVGSRVAGRSNNFRVDPEIHSQQAEPEDYRNSGYDRGHLAPAADMAWSETTMSESFFMSNISPQQPAFNRGIWAKLEAQVRAFAVAEGELYVVTGPVLSADSTATIGAGRVAVPTGFYKVIYDLTPPCKMIAFMLPNGGSRRPLQDFVVTVDMVEAATGLDFFPRLPEPEERELESTVDLQQWNWR